MADVIREAAGRYEERYGLSVEHRRIVRDLTRCRTAALGGHKRVCDRCGHEHISYNSCRNRHCPKCQAQARARWLDDRVQDLLEVPYFHNVFTVPEAIGPRALYNRRPVYGILFRAMAETLLTIGRDPKHLGAEIGFVAMLHTWGQRLQLHPHVHCVVPGGGFSPDATHWIPCRGPHFFLPVRVLSRLFRGKFLALLGEAHEEGRLRFPGRLSLLQVPENWSRWLAELKVKEWVVYAKPPFGGPRQVLKYLARYTHRVAISNQRLLGLEDGKVTFEYKDYARGNRVRTMRLDSVAFLRRFLLHTIPSGFMRIRHYGFLANRVRRQKLAHARRLLRESGVPERLAEPEPRDPSAKEDPWHCPACRAGHLVLVGSVAPFMERDPPARAA